MYTCRLKRRQTRARLIVRAIATPFILFPLSSFHFFLSLSPFLFRIPRMPSNIVSKYDVAISGGERVSLRRNIACIPREERPAHRASADSVRARSDNCVRQLRTRARARVARSVYLQFNNPTSRRRNRQGLRSFRASRRSISRLTLRISTLTSRRNVYFNKNGTEHALMYKCMCVRACMYA